MFFAVKEVNQLQHVVFVRITVRVDVLEKLDLIERLVEEIFTILYHLCV